LVLDLDRARELQRVGSALAVVDGGRGVNVIVACTGRGRYAALDRTCTHGGAMCAYEHDRRSLRCTSLNHAEYALDGTLLHGRSHGNLRAYEARRRGSRLEIALRPGR
jgi:nitrite reductase/ring-hydroxylating ferredoxin subunit